MSKTLYIVSDGTLKRRHNTLLVEQTNKTHKSSLYIDLLKAFLALCVVMYVA